MKVIGTIPLLLASVIAAPLPAKREQSPQPETQAHGKNINTIDQIKTALYEFSYDCNSVLGYKQCEVDFSGKVEFIEDCGRLRKTIDNLESAEKHCNEVIKDIKNIKDAKKIDGDQKNLDKMYADTLKNFEGFKSVIASERKNLETANEKAQKAREEIYAVVDPLRREKIWEGRAENVSQSFGEAAKQVKASLNKVANVWKNSKQDLAGYPKLESLLKDPKAFFTPLRWLSLDIDDGRFSTELSEKCPTSVDVIMQDIGLKLKKALGRKSDN